MGNLASIESQEEQDSAFLLTGSSGAWIGLNDILVEGTFEWVDRSTLSYTNWKSGQPNNVTGQNCVWMRRNDQTEPGTWDDVVCGGSRAYLCERPAL